MELLRKRRSYTKERDVYLEAIQLMGEAYYKIALLNLRTGICRYLKASDEELERVGVAPTSKQELDYSEWQRRTCEMIIHPDYRKQFLRDFSLEELLKFCQCGDKYRKMRYLRWDIEKNEYHWVEAEFTRRHEKKDEIILYIKDIQDEIDREIEHQQTIEEMQESTILAYESKRHFVKRASVNLFRPLKKLMMAGERVENALYANDVEEMDASIHDISQMTGRLWDMMSELMDVSRLQQGNLALELKPFQVNNLVDECKVFFRKYSGEKRLSFMWVGNLEGIYLGDERRIIQALHNLLENAIDYNQVGGTVMMSAEQDGEQFTFVVRDTGTGMSSGEINKLYQPFYVGENQEYKCERGIGIGLPLVKGILDLMQGEISYESELGVGTVVTIKFKLKKVI